jgi:hypothetical protein
MGSSSDEEIITLKGQIGHQSDEESQIIANEIDNELLIFFNQEVVQDENTNVIAVMSKGLNLFHPYLESIKDMRTIISVKSLIHKDPYSMDYRFLSPYNNRSNILLTDAIKTGAEIRKILTHSPFKFKIFGGIKKVCGYMALKNALDELENDYPDISFTFLKVIEDLDEYYEEHKKIIYVYQKRMAPIDGEHGYFIIDCNPALSFTDIKEIIQESFQQRYGSCFELLNNNLGIETKHNFTVYFDPSEDLLRNLFNIQLHDGDIIEKLSIRFKYSSDDSKLRVMALSMPHLGRENLLQYGRRKIFASCRRTLPKRNCHINPLVRLIFSFDRNTMCSKCVDTNISGTVLKDVYFMFSQSGLRKKN